MSGQPRRLDTIGVYDTQFVDAESSVCIAKPYPLLFVVHIIYLPISDNVEFARSRVSTHNVLVTPALKYKTILVKTLLICAESVLRLPQARWRIMLSLSSEKRWVGVLGESGSQLIA
jgi:hypothetical protein